MPIDNIDNDFIAERAAFQQDFQAYIEETEITIANRYNAIKYKNTANNILLDYSINISLDNLAASWNATVVDTEVRLEPGYLIRFALNRNVAFQGVIQLVSRSVSKNSTKISISGKDWVSLLIESYCIKFGDYVKTPKALLEDLIGINEGIPGQSSYYNAPKSFVYSDPTGFSNQESLNYISALLGDAGTNDKLISSKEKRVDYDPDFEGIKTTMSLKIRPGDMVFDKIQYILNQYSKYTIYYDTVNSQLFVGDLDKKRIEAGVQHKITFKENGSNNNIISSSVTEDISNRYSKIIMVTNLEGGISDQAYIYKKGAEQYAVTDKTILGWEKTMFVLNSDKKADSEKTLNKALKIREEQRREGFKLEYEVIGHLDNKGKLWGVNKTVTIEDEINNVHGPYMIYGVTYNFSVEKGNTTTLYISHEFSNLVDYQQKKVTVK